MRPTIIFKVVIPEADLMCAIDSVLNGDVVLANSLLKNSESALVFSDVGADNNDDGENFDYGNRSFFFCDELISEDRFDAI